VDVELHHLKENDSTKLPGAFSVTEEDGKPMNRPRSNCAVAASQSKTRARETPDHHFHSCRSRRTIGL